MSFREDGQRVQVLRSRSECMDITANWVTKHSDCLKKYAIWTKGSTTASFVDTSTPNALETLHDLQPAVAIESRSASPSVDEWEGFLCYLIPSVSVAIVCIVLGILAHCSLEYIHKKRQQSVWSANSRHSHPNHPSAPHMLFLSHGRYSRANSITSFVSLPPAYNTTVSKERSQESAKASSSQRKAEESPPPDYETALKALSPIKNV